MADTKISALPASTTPLAGTEVLPIVQSGVTKQVSVADLTAGRAISATQLTLTTGNLIVANGQGVDFSATPGTGTSELFNDYETGTFSPTISGTTIAGTGTYNAAGGLYTKVGNLVTVQIYINLASHTGTGNILITGLPFTSASGASSYGSATIGYLDNCSLVALNYPLAFISPSVTAINLAQSPVGGGALNLVAMDTSFSIMISATYRAA
jgi:hypothetical protein